MLLATVAVAAAAVTAQEVRTVPARGAAPPLRYVELLPKELAAGSWVPLLVAFPEAGGETGARNLAAELAEVPAAGFVVAVPVRDARAWADDLGPLFSELRRRFRIAQGGMHALLPGDQDTVRASAAQRHQFQTVTFTAPVGDAQRTLLQGARARRVTTARPQLVAHLQELHRARQLTGTAADVARTLDDFHDAAAVGDGERYFAILPDDAVFLGTDATERWNGAEFRAFAMPYFARGPAWTYVALARYVTVAPAGDIAWFDEVLDNASYGECRGTGVLVRRGGAWVVQLYDLTIPIPNDLAGAVTRRIRAFADRSAPAVTTIVLVRHAEKVDDSRDAALSDQGRARAAALAQALRDLPVDAAYATEFQRTAATLGPLCTQRSLQPTTLPAAETGALAGKLLRDHCGQTVVVCGHSNTVPFLLQALGMTREIAIGDDEYDRLFVVTLGLDGPRLLQLRY